MKLLIINTLVSALITSDFAHAALRGSVYTSDSSSCLEYGEQCSFHVDCCDDLRCGREYINSWWYTCTPKPLGGGMSEQAHSYTSNFYESMSSLIQSDAREPSSSSSSEDNQRLNRRAWKWDDSRSESEESMSSDDSNSTSFDSSSDEYSSSSEDYHSGSGGNGWLNDDSSSSDDFRRVQPFTHHGKGSSSSSEDLSAESFIKASCKREGQVCGWPLGDCCAGMRCRSGLWGGPGVCR